MVETGNPYRDNVSRLITWGHWFSFFNIILAMLISTRYLGAISWPSTTLGVTYLVISWIGHFSFLSFVTYLLTIFPLSFILPREKPLRFISSIIATLALVLLLIDTQVFQLFKFHLNGQVWQLLLDQAQTEEGSIWSIIFVAVPAIFLLQLGGCDPVSTHHHAARQLPPLLPHDRQELPGQAWLARPRAV